MFHRERLAGVFFARNGKICPIQGEVRPLGEGDDVVDDASPKRQLPQAPSPTRRAGPDLGREAA